MTQLNVSQHSRIEVKEEFRFVYLFYNRLSSKSGPVKIGLYPTKKRDREKPLKTCRLKMKKSDFIH
jgi:hypothetical protein